MAKINYAKVEQRLVSGLRKMFVEKLYEHAGPKKPPLAQGEVRKESVSTEEAKLRMLEAVQSDLKHLSTKTTDVHERLGISQKELGRLVDDPGALSAQDWEQLHKLKEAIEEENERFREQIKDPRSDNLQVEEEVMKHRHKRFNARKGWVPLDTHTPPPPRRRRKPGSWEEEE